MTKKHHKYKLLLDEGMHSRKSFPRLNSFFDVKHIYFDLKMKGLPDKQVYNEAVKLKRLLVTFNGKDFKQFAKQSKDTGILALSQQKRPQELDRKLTAMLRKPHQKSFYGKYTAIPGKTVQPH